MLTIYSHQCIAILLFFLPAAFSYTLFLSLCLYLFLCFYLCLCHLSHVFFTQTKRNRIHYSVMPKYNWAIRKKCLETPTFANLSFCPCLVFAFPLLIIHMLDFRLFPQFHSILHFLTNWLLHVFFMWQYKPFFKEYLLFPPKKKL